jgi:hypothetical protein
MRRRLTERSVDTFDSHRGELAQERHRLAEPSTGGIEE